MGKFSAVARHKEPTGRNYLSTLVRLASMKRPFQETGSATRKVLNFGLLRVSLCAFVLKNPLFEAVLWSQSRKELELLAWAGAGAELLKFRLWLPAPAPGQLKY